MSKRNVKESIESTLSRIWLVNILRKIQFLVVIICFAAIALAIWLQFTGGTSKAIITLASFGTSMGVFSYLIGKYIERSVNHIKEFQKVMSMFDMRQKMDAKPAIASHKIPLTIGFANLVGESMASTLLQDYEAISDLFLKSSAPPPHQIPSAEVLFVYANLGEDGTISPEGTSGIRQIVQLTNAAIVVVASPNSQAAIKNAVDLPGQKTANIVFTFSRNGHEFGKFFHSLFEKMRDGKEMLSAWVELSPQIPNGSPHGGPQTILLAERGKIAFPREGDHPTTS